MRNNATNALYWQADTANAEGALTQITHGNFVTTTQSYDANTGRIATIAASNGGTPVQNMSFVFDTIGNLASRTDVIADLVESFTYDDLNRVTGATIVQGVNAPAVKTFSYNATGNIVTKSDHGVYSYPAQGASSVRPNAVSSVVTASGTKTYVYDANGNMTSGDGRTMTWTPFNMPLTIAQGATTLTFAYDTERQRVKQTAPDGTTHYINDTSAGLKSEKFIGASSTRWVNYVYAGGGIAAVVNIDSVAGTTTRYFHKDHLGSTAVITDESGAVVERLAYDAWGKRRNTNGNDDPTNSLTSLTTRGFTGHEHLQAVALVHMNGRVYDPLLGRFLSADPHIQDPLNTQSLNRYSYVLNNPLAYTDPNGFFFKSITRFFSKNPIAAMIVGIAVAWATGGISLLATGGINITFAGAVTAGATSGLLTGGIKGAILGGISGAITAGIGDLGLGFMGDAAFLGKAALHGVAQGALATVQGGDFGSAFLSAGFSSIAGSALKGAFPGRGVGAVIANTVATAVVGGSASVIGGGKFQNGAATGAFVYLLSYAAEQIAKDNTLVGRTSLNGGTAEQQAAVRESLGRIDGTEAGKALAADIGARNIIISIQDFPSLNADADKGYLIRIDPRFIDRLVCCFTNSAGTPSLFTLDRVLGHELGHLTGVKDGPSALQMENVNKWENPIMRELSPDQEDRARYFFPGRMQELFVFE